MLYEAAIESVGRAIKHIRAGDIEARTREISRAQAIITELMTSLNHQAAPELCRNLTDIYDYLLRRIQDAQFQQSEEPLKEVARLLGTLLEGWLAVVPAAA